MRTALIVALAGILAGCNPTAPTSQDPPHLADMDPTFDPPPTGPAIVCFRAPCEPLPQ